MNNKNIKLHYNKLKSVPLNDRFKSKIINIRQMNNFIKSMLIQMYAKTDVLDIGCGKGGDLKKYLNTDTNYYYGLDIAENSIKEAESRYFQLIKSNHKEDNKDKMFDAKFTALDCYNESFNIERKFELISCQFSFHYAFSSEKSFNTTLENINNHLKENGYFILTIPNTETLLRRYHNYKNDYGNNYYKVKFKDSYEDIINNESKFGIEYFFMLEEAIENCVEYLIDFDVMKKELLKMDIECILYEDFLTFFNNNVKRFIDLYKRMVKGKLNKEELKVIELYSVAVFKKKPVNLE